MRCSLVSWCDLLSTWVAKLNEQFTCCIWHNSDVAVKIILVLQSKLLSLPYLCLPVLMRKTHNEETPPQAPSSHPFFLSCLFFLVLALCSCFWCCSTSPGLRQVPSESMSCVPFQCYFHFNTNTFSFTDCALSSLYLRFPLLPEEVNERNISESMPSGSFPKAPGHSQSPTWISSGNSLKIWRKRDHLVIQQLSERQVNKCLKCVWQSERRADQWDYRLFYIAKSCWQTWRTWGWGSF